MNLLLSRYTKNRRVVWVVTCNGQAVTQETDETTAREMLEKMRQENGRASVMGWDGDKSEHFTVR